MLKQLFGKNAGADLAAIEAKIEALKKQRAGLEAEKQAAQDDLETRVAADAIGTEALSEKDHRALCTAVRDAEDRLGRALMSLAALEGRLPELRRAALADQAAAVLGRIRPVNAEVLRVATDLHKALAKVRELRDKLATHYNQAGALEKEYVGIMERAGEQYPSLPEEMFTWPNKASFEFWLQKVGFSMDADEVEFLLFTAETERARQEAEAAERRERQKQQAESDERLRRQASETKHQTQALEAVG